MDKIINFLRWWKNSWLFKPTIYFIIFLVIVYIFDQFIMPAYVKLGKEEELPDVREMQIEEANDLLSSRGFQVIIKDSLYDGHRPIGTVVEQNPYPHAIVKKGRRVYLSVSIGEEPIKVPDLFGKSLMNARLILKSFNLDCYPIYQYSNQYPADVVIGQYPDMGERIKPGGRVSVNVSLGKKKEGLVVPNFIDKSLYEAKEQVATLGIRLGNIRYEKRANILPETVLSQSVKPGTLLEPNMAIDLVVSKLE